MRDVVVQFYLPYLHESKADGRQILHMICELLPELAPEFYSSYEPINKRFHSIETALNDWGSSFLWKRKSSAANGMVTFGSAHPRRPFHTSVWLEGRLEILDNERLTHFVREFSKAFQPDVSLIHIFPKTGHGNRQPIFNLSTFVMRESLPNLYWVTVFGRPYINLFGKERLLSTPAAVVREIAEDVVYMQLTEHLMDNRKQAERVEVVRQGAKRHLDSNVFFDPQLSPNHVYRTPEFQIRVSPAANR